MKSSIGLLLGILLFGLLAWLVHSQQGIPLAGTGWVAKRTCSGVFVGGRPVESLHEASLPLPLPISIEASVDRIERSVTAYFGSGYASTVARFRPGIGCTLIGPGDSPSPLEAVDPGRLPPIPAGAPMARGESPEGLDRAIDEVFVRTPEQEAQGLGTRAVVVLQRGRIIAERYADGFSRETPLPGWSMTKSVTSAIVGLLVDAGRVDLHAPVGLDEWSEPGDPRGEITWDHLLRMSSGLAFEENYDLPSSDAIQMLFGLERASKGAYAAGLPLEHEIDTHWSYSSGTTNLIQYALLTRVFDGNLEAYLAYPRETLFRPLGMSSALMEPDARGTFVGSSFMFATARDWARFGQLFLNQGVWEGRRILSSEWVRYSGTPTPTNDEGIYGAQWWLNADPANGARRWPALPSNILVASGFEGQVIVVVPDAELVVVRLGLDRGIPFDVEHFVANVVGSVGSVGSVGPVASLPERG